jgi:hypothetical protein
MVGAGAATGSAGVGLILLGFVRFAGFAFSAVGAAVLVEWRGPLTRDSSDGGTVFAAGRDFFAGEAAFLGDASLPDASVSGAASVGAAPVGAPLVGAALVDADTVGGALVGAASVGGPSWGTVLLGDALCGVLVAGAFVTGGDGGVESLGDRIARAGVVRGFLAGVGSGFDLSVISVTACEGVAFMGVVSAAGESATPVLGDGDSGTPV